MRIWTLTTDSDGIETTVHRSERDAVATLFDTFDPTGEYASDVQALLDGEGIVAHIDEHEIELS